MEDVDCVLNEVLLQLTYDSQPLLLPCYGHATA